jgi:NAD(P) transhydrogenase subunit beta
MEYSKLFYVLAAILFILGLKKLSHPKTARGGNTMASIGMFIAIVTTLLASNNLDFTLIIAGIVIGGLIGGVFAAKIEMTQMPQMVAIFNGFGGAASALVAGADFIRNIDKLQTGVFINGLSPTFYLVVVILSIFVGTLTFTGSFIAFGKLQGFISGQPIVFPGQQIFNAIFAFSMVTITAYLVMGGNDLVNFFYAIVFLSALMGVTLTIPIGGADMPVVISLLNSYSGVAAAATGFVLMNNGLIISGALVGASGLILTNIMCKGMNRSLTNVIF